MAAALRREILALQRQIAAREEKREPVSRELVVEREPVVDQIAIRQRLEQRVKFFLLKRYLTDNDEYDLKQALNRLPKKDVEALIDIQDANGRTALHRAAINGDHKVVKLLLDKGANINLQDDNGWAAIHYAIEKDPDPYVDTEHSKVFKMLMTKGADIDIQNNEGDTPLIIASAKYHLKDAKALLKAGANPLVLNNRDETAYDIAFEQVEEEPELLDLLEKYSR